MAGESVLLVEDEPTARSYLEQQLSDDGFAVLSADQGRRALEVLERAYADLVLLDVGLPDLDGIEVTRRLSLVGGPKVVLTSSRDASDYPPHFDHCGARGFIPKAELSGPALAAIAA